MRVSTFYDADFSQPVYQEVIGNIHYLIEDGIQSVNEVENRVKDFFRSRSNRYSNQRYNPNRKQIYNIMYSKKNKIG